MESWDINLHQDLAQACDDLGHTCLSQGLRWSPGGRTFFLVQSEDTALSAGRDLPPPPVWSLVPM